MDDAAAEQDSPQPTDPPASSHPASRDELPPAVGEAYVLQVFQLALTHGRAELRVPDRLEPKDLIKLRKLIELVGLDLDAESGS